MTFLIFALLSLGIFAVPLRLKWAAAMTVTAAGALYALAAAVCSLAGCSCSLLPECDALSALFLIIIAVSALSVTLYSRGYIADMGADKSAAHISLHRAAMSTLAFSMMSVVCVQDGAGFLFCWELMTIASFVLVMFDAEKSATRRAAINYLVMMHAGFIFLLAGFVILGQAGCQPSFAGMQQYLATHSPYGLLALFLVGFGMKAGLFPLHVWLPEAHPAAPAHISAMMSGVMIKTGVYGVLRILSNLHTGFDTAGAVLLALGVVTGLWGVILAALQNDIKRMLAYSSIENIGIIFIGIGSGLLGISCGNSTLALCCLGGAVLHTVNHSLFKTVLFLGAGNIYSRTHTASLEQLGGLGRRMPATAALFLFGSAAICALPPLSGFVSEFLIYAGLASGIAEGVQVLPAAGAMAALSLIGGIVLLAFCKLCGVVFSGQPRSQAAAHASETDPLRIVSFSLSVAGIAAIGLLPVLFVQPAMQLCAGLFSIPVPEGGFPLRQAIQSTGSAAFILVLLSAALMLLKSRALSRRSVSKSPTWGCGFEYTNSRMQYSGESFSEGLQNIASSMTDDRASGSEVQGSEIFPRSHAFRIRHKDRIDNIVSRWWMLLLKEMSRRVESLSSNRINRYILCALLFLASVLVLSLLNVL